MWGVRARREFIDYKTSMIAYGDPLRGYLSSVELCFEFACKEDCGALACLATFAKPREGSVDGRWVMSTRLVCFVQAPAPPPRLSRLFIETLVT